MWGTKNAPKEVATESTVKLCFQMPPIAKMDPGLKELAHVEFLSLSTNCIEKIANLNGFKNLKILSLGRNNIKGLAGLEQVADTLEQLWISYNPIEKLKGVSALKKVKTLYISNCKIKDWKEFEALKDMSSLEELVTIGNPLQEKHAADGDWLEQVSQRLPNLKKLDGIPIVGGGGGGD
jgi:dynein light chain 1